MKRVAIVHHTFPGLGGGERFVVAVIEALNSAGIVPDVFTRRPVGLALLKRTYGKEPSFNYRPVRRLLPYRGERLVLYRKVATSLIFRPRGYDVVFNCAVGEFSPVKLGNTDSHFLYVFNPMFDWPKPERGAKRAYTKPFRTMVVSAVRALRERVFVNSAYTARRVEGLWGVRPRVLYSPIDPLQFAPAADGPRSGVISVGRFSPEKQQQFAIRIASKVEQDTRLTLAGTAVTSDTAAWLAALRALVKSSRQTVRVLPNLPFERLREELWKAKVFLHTFPQEDLGLAPLEAIAAGCVPVVPDSGGNIETVPIRELRYRSTDEATLLVGKALRGEFDGYLPRLRAHLDTFSQARFQTDLLSALRVP